ncbi:SSI family serine proteinase inhibitor [Streptomyces sp. DSM 42041]|uniref:SSI family serine proteinase inhibitor n=1 Tax=Streptomyces hazeniae TaxID=3075538 RepID=A0ABU2NPE9_9ACTN|nr:SSI family serine proteinase inhibitor [Streptomyces sp. DSM 42041]MDT0378854.1 SSI family serine proteinase inhibitor [Streptomyces sp. DSM 42041]
MPRRTAPTLAALAGAAAVLATLLGAGAASAAAPQETGFSTMPPAQADYLSITVSGTGDARHDGTRSLFCHPAGGTHPRAQAACEALDAAVSAARTAGRDPEGPVGRSGDTQRALRAPAAGPFAPVPSEAVCTMVHGGPAHARIKGVWHGKPVDARFDRSNGCEMSRWDRLVPVLPALN